VAPEIFIAMKIRIILIQFLLLQSYLLFPQIDFISWQQCLGTDEGTNWTNAVEKAENGYMFGIYIEKNGPDITNYHGNGDSWIVNTDSSGNILWERSYGGSGGDGPEKIIKFDESSFYLLNYSLSEDGDVQNGRSGYFWIVKINAIGEILWENSYGGTINGEVVIDAILMPDKGLLLMGRISSAGGDVTTYYGDMDVWLCRIDSCGSILWEKTYGNQGKDNGFKIKLSANNTVLMIGGHYESGGMIDCPQMGTDGADVWIVEMDLHGNMLNQWCFGGSHNDLGCDIFELEDGYVFAALTNSNDGDVSGFHGNEWNEFDDFWVVKIDFNGNIIWQKCLGGSSWEYPVYLTQTGDGGFVIIGNTCSLDGDVTGNHSWDDIYADIWVVKLNSEGELEWEHSFGGGSTERFWGIHSVLKKDDYNYVLGANSNYLDGDVECDLFPNDLQDNAWLLEIKDCNYYLPETPVISSGPDTLCSTTNTTSIYGITQVSWAWDYEWSLEPENAGTMIQDSLSAVITWNIQFEGQASIKARSYNDCGSSAWSEPHMTQVYTCMGLEEFGGTGISFIVQPNPAREKIHVRLNMDSLSASWRNGRFNKDLGLEIYDIFGRKVGEINLPSPAVGEGQGGGWTVDVSAFPPGIYLAVLREGQSVQASAKFVVVR
jgi:hypothetical protein